MPAGPRCSACQRQVTGHPDDPRAAAAVTSDRAQLVAEVDDMIWQAVRAGFDYFQREAGYTRTGSHNTRVHGRETGQWHEADLVVACLLYTSPSPRDS